MLCIDCLYEFSGPSNCAVNISWRNLACECFQTVAACSVDSVRSLLTSLPVPSPRRCCHACQWHHAPSLTPVNPTAGWSVCSTDVP